MTVFTFALALLIGAKAGAAELTLPDLNSPIQVGRLAVYKSSRDISWFAPTAFSSDFECTGSERAAKRTCALRIYNALNQEEESQLERLRVQEGLRLLHFTDVDSSVVSNIQERFEGTPADLDSGSAVLPKTLNILGEKASYAGFMSRLPGDRVPALLEAYNNQGLGQFVVAYKMRAKKTDLYIGFQDGACFFNNLEAVKNTSLGSSKLRRWIEQVIKTCGLTVIGEVQAGAQFLAATIATNYFDHSFLWGYSVKKDKLSHRTETVTLLESVLDPKVLVCETRLPLQRGAVPVSRCTPIDDGVEQ